jgi:acyl-CoA dehydrogenase
MAKAFATEMAQRVIDRAVQLFGGHGVRAGVKVEALYREIRALRIYEGATEVQKIVIARELMKARDLQQQAGPGVPSLTAKAHGGM